MFVERKKIIDVQKTFSAKWGSCGRKILKSIIKGGVFFCIFLQLLVTFLNRQSFTF